MRYKYGLDFGTTNSSIAIRHVDTDSITQPEITQVIVVKRQYPRETLPSLVWVGESGKIVAGHKALDQVRSKTEKGLLIRRIKMDLEEKGSALEYSVGKKRFSGVDLIASILALLRREAEAYATSIGIEVHGVVMGVPVQYGDIQKRIPIQALVKAGFYKDEREAERETEFVSEPVAVAVDYGLDIEENKNVMIFDFGGGTLDIAIVNLKKQVGALDRLHPHETLAKDRMTLGGEELNRLFFVEVFPSKYGLDNLCRAFRAPRLTAEKLWEHICRFAPDFVRKIEECKCALSTAQSYSFSYMGAGILLPEKRIYLKDFEKAIAPKIEEIRSFVDHLVAECVKVNALEDKYDIDKVVVAGGSSLIPCVQQLLHDIFGPSKVMERIQPSEVLTSIVRGLALVGCRQEAQVEDVVDSDYGIMLEVNIGDEAAPRYKKQFEPIISRGTKVIDTRIDIIRHTGCLVDVKAKNEDGSSICMEVCQRTNHRTMTLGKIRWEMKGETKYKIFMQVDPVKGCLEVRIFDKGRNRWKNEIPLNERTYTLN